MLLLGLPACLLAFFTLSHVADYLSIASDDKWLQTAFFAVGICGAILFFNKRFRFASTTAVLLVLAFLVHRALNKFSIGEFDTFFLNIKLYVLGGLFLTGWLVGFSFSRWRLFSLLWSLGILAALIWMIATGRNVVASSLVSIFIPVIGYSVFTIFIAELLRSSDGSDRHFAQMVAKKTLGFAGVLALLLLAVFFLFKNRFNQLEKDLAASKMSEKSNASMTKQNKDGTLSNADGMQLSGGLNKGKSLVFVAHLNNFFADSVTPNPLYFTSTLYSKFDAQTQTFEIDSLRPSNDLFSPDPSQIPLFFSKIDSSVIRNGLGNLSRRVVSAEIFKVALSPHDYLAPSIGFYCQPIAIPAEYGTQFKSAYRAKMWASDLNSAYLVYNPGNNEMAQQMQVGRYDSLRTKSDYSKVNHTFLQYYTQMPGDASYQRIAQLARQITAKAPATIDKMLAIRNYFSQKDASGQPLFQYSDNPGIPGMPSANKLNYFLFENRKGYCAYFAGATLFLLRALGVPSRIAAGFMTIDRSNKNPGWYWFYEDQAHAWVQVYFPEYGWIDFDTTIPDENVQQAEQPDGTPPMGLQQFYFVADGTIKSIDASGKNIVLTTPQILLHDNNMKLSHPTDIELDVSLAKIHADSGAVALASLKTGMHITAASGVESLKNLTAQNGESGDAVLARIAQPVPMDEIKVILSKEEQQKQLAQQTTTATQKTFDQLKWLILAAILIVLSLALIPWLIWKWYQAKAQKSVYYSYRAALFYLQQHGYAKNGKAPLVFAQEIDRQFGTSFLQLNKRYQEWKYSADRHLAAKDAQEIKLFLPEMVKKIQAQISPKERWKDFLQWSRTIDFLMQKK